MILSGPCLDILGQGAEWECAGGPEQPHQLGFRGMLEIFAGVMLW